MNIVDKYKRDSLNSIRNKLEIGAYKFSTVYSYKRFMSHIENNFNVRWNSGHLPTDYYHATFNSNKNMLFIYKSELIDNYFYMLKGSIDDYQFPAYNVSVDIKDDLTVVRVK